MDHLSNEAYRESLLHKFSKRFPKIMMMACKGFVMSILIFYINMHRARENVLEVIKCHLQQKISQKRYCKDQECAMIYEKWK